MSMELSFNIAPEIFDCFPNVTVGGMIVDNLKVAAARIDAVPLLRRAEEALRNQGITVETLTQDPRIGGWRDAFRKQSLKASTYRSSPEALARRVLRGQSIGTALPVVDLYNAISVRFLSPMGGYDVGRLPQPRVCLRFARPNGDQFSPLGGRREDMPLTHDIVIYGVSDEVACWAFNHRDSVHTCLQVDTKTAAFFSEAVTPQQRQGIEAGLEELSQVLREAGAIVSSISIADRQNATFAFTQFP